MRPVDVIRGLPVLSRFRISRRCQNSILLAAFLGQPIIPVGHHQDVAEGLGIFRELADYINQLGNVQWTDLGAIVRGMYSTRLEGSTLCVRMDARHADVVVPSGVDSVRVEHTWHEPAPQNLTVNSAEGSVAIPYSSSPATVLPVSARQRLSLSIKPLSQLAVSDVAKRTRKNRLTLWPITRRLLTEGRDRLSPAYRKFRST